MVGVRLRNDRWQQENASEFTEAEVDADLARLFGYARCWAKDANRRDPADLTFSAILAAMVADDQPLSAWLRLYFDRLAVPSSQITRHRSYPGAALYADAAGASPHLLTTTSFRTALALACELRDEISTGQPVAVRHFVAAYAVCPDYHLQDFRRYRIDRREWCLSLSAELARGHPGESDGWLSYASRAPQLLPLAFANDTPQGWDRLHLGREVSAFARLIASRATTTPLSIGVFGAWGSGKTFFMHRTREQVAELAAAAARDPRSSEFHGRVAQVEFNVWNYRETNLIASLVDHIFRNLRIDAVDEDEAAVARRGAEIISLLDDAKEGLATAATGVSVAADRLAVAEADLQRAQAELPAEVQAAHLVLADAEYAERKAHDDVERARRQRDEDIAAAKAVAAGATLIGEVGGATTKSAVSGAADELIAVIATGRQLYERRRKVVIGAVLAAVSVTIAALASTELWERAVAAVAAIGVIAAGAKRWLSAAGRLAERADDFRTERAAATEAAAARVAAARDGRVAELEAVLVAKQAAAAAARQHLDSTAQARSAKAALDASRAALTAARDERAEAQRDADQLQVQLDATSIDQRLADFLDERIATDDYRSQLGIFSEVRNDFERLSRLMSRATTDHYEHGRPPPTLSRIVLYIDDLDRCSAVTVLEVLRAVHLLLAFPLFVCVVAVDPRWLTTCLEHAPGIATEPAGRRTAPAASALDDQFGRPADPADYIEKIFQVPIWLRPVPESLRPALLRSWFEAPGSVDAEPATTTAAELSTAELEFLDHLAALLPDKPRTLKRLANTYRLVRTSLSDVQFESFADDRTSAAPYRICLTQLAILSTDRERALRMTASLDGASNERTVGEWLEHFALADDALAATLRSTLPAALDLQEFRDWLERTRRYSFYL